MIVEFLVGIGFMGLVGLLCYLFFIRTQNVLQADKWKDKVVSLLEEPSEILRWSLVEKKGDGSLQWKGLALVGLSLKIVHATYTKTGDRIEVQEDEPWMIFLGVISLPRLDLAVAAQHLVRIIESKGFQDPIVGAPSHKRGEEGWEYIEFSVDSKGYGLQGIVFLSGNEYRLGYFEKM